MQNTDLAEELNKPLTKEFAKRKVHPSFIVNICGTDLAGIQLISKLIMDFDFHHVLLIFTVNMLIL